MGTPDWVGQPSWQRAKVDTNRLLFRDHPFIALAVNVALTGITSIAAQLVAASSDASTTDRIGIGLGTGPGAFIVGLILIWVMAYAIRILRTPYKQRDESWDFIRAQARPLDVRIEELNKAAYLIGPGEARLMGGWLYVVDFRITNRERRTVTLVVDMIVRLVGRHGHASRMRLSASHTPAHEIDDWLDKTKRLTELGQIPHIEQPISVEPGAMVRGYLAFLLPETMIPKEGGSFLEAGEFLSDEPPESETLIVEDTVSDRVLRLDDWHVFQRLSSMLGLAKPSASSTLEGQD